MDVTVVPTTAHELLTIDQMVDWLTVSKRTIDTYIQQGMPVLRLGTRGMRRFKRTAVLAWLQARAATTAQRKQELKKRTAGLHPTRNAMH